MKNITIILTLISAHIAFCQDTYLIKNVRLFDGNQVLESTDILISNGVVVLNGLLAVAHISRYDDAQKLVKLGIDGLVHLWSDVNLDNEFLNQLLTDDVFIVPTLSIKEAALDYYEENGIKHAISPREENFKELSKLHGAGVPILAGTYPPNLGLDYGSSLHNELRLYVRAGLTPLEAIRTATTNPNKKFDLDDIGMIKEGRLANFNLIDGNPLKNIDDISSIHSVWAGGKKIK